MNTVALVPVNALSAAKSRLNAALSAAERRALVLWMAGRLLTALRDSGTVTTTLVVSPDIEALAWAAASGAATLYQSGSGLNAGLELGRRWALDHGAETLLVLLGDLPTLTAQEIAAFVADARVVTQPHVALAPDRHERGTNGLLLRPVDALPFAFGEGSLARHRALARAAGIEPTLFHAPGMAFDVDTPHDLRELQGWRRQRSATPVDVVSRWGGEHP